MNLMLKNRCVMYLGDPFSFYLTVAGSISHLLLWIRGGDPSICQCECGNLEQRSAQVCSGLVKDLLSFCWENGPSQSTTTTTTVLEVRSPWGWWWWLIVLVFLLGCFAGQTIRISPSGNRRAALPAAPAIADPQAARVRRGLAA